MRGRDGYEALLEALGVCIDARVPFLLWGDPGEGKTAVVESAAEQGWHVETLIVSHHEPSDFAGLPVVGREGTVTLAPPAWAQRRADHTGPSLAICVPRNRERRPGPGTRPRSHPPPPAMPSIHPPRLPSPHVFPGVTLPPVPDLRSSDRAPPEGR